MDMVEKIVTNRLSYRLTKDEGWYSEAEMKSELNWSAYLCSIYTSKPQTLTHIMFQLVCSLLLAYDML